MPLYECYICIIYGEESNLCSTGTQLSNEMSKAHEALRKAKVSRTFAKGTYNSAKKDKNKWQGHLNDYTKKRDDYQKDKDALPEFHANALSDIESLTLDIEAKSQEIGAAEVDLDKETKKKSPFMEYIDDVQDWASRGKAAYDAGKDMDEWEENNPMPTRP